MQIRLALEVDDPQDADPESSTGITAGSYDRLVDALADAGFSILDGPDQVYPDADQLDIAG